MWVEPAVDFCSPPGRPPRRWYWGRLARLAARPRDRAPRVRRPGSSDSSTASCRPSWMSSYGQSAPGLYGQSAPRKRVPGGEIPASARRDSSRCKPGGITSLRWVLPVSRARWSTAGRPRRRVGHSVGRRRQDRYGGRTPHSQRTAARRGAVRHMRGTRTPWPGEARGQARVGAAWAGAGARPPAGRRASSSGAAPPWRPDARRPSRPHRLALRHRYATGIRGIRRRRAGVAARRIVG